ncbi:DUF6350 family protein [Asanoa sp. WMMD1127]|uniref:cell division protein PerM n=1 Tax=Asanoa sp. WMMD1127 TaxID=3016107 RepID=UPI002415A119|nr:DUF6350 family protein [Asanoa sp. WMMD1127]MDG4821086.1 DUF6350 family protein [Asanoa sp. WMMD1127]
MRSPTPDGQTPAADDRRDPPAGPVRGMGTDQEAIGIDLPRHDDPPLVRRTAAARPDPEPETDPDPAAGAEPGLDDVRHRPTQPIDVRDRPTDRPDPSDVRNRPTEPIDVGNRPTVRLPRQRPAPPTNRAPLLIAGAVAALFAAAFSFLPVAAALALAQLTAGVSELGDAVRAGLAGWLLAHGVPPGTSLGPLGLPPLAVAAFAAWRVSRAGVHTSRAYGIAQRGSPLQAATVAGTVGLGYGVVGTAAALLADQPGLEVSALRAFVHCLVFGTLSALVGALRVTGALRVMAVRMPPVLRDGIRTGVVGAVLVLGTGAAMAGLSVALSGGDAADVLGAYRTGVAGQVGITLICLAYAPNAAIWAAAYLLGPGFAVGVDTIVRTTEVDVGTLLPLPLAAGIPQGPVGGLGALLLAAPLLAGMVAGWLLARRVLRLRAGDAYGRHRSWGSLVGAAAVGGPVAGLLLGLAAQVSRGPVGGPRLAEMGPVAWQVALAGALVMTIGATVGAAATRALAGP